MPTINHLADYKIQIPGHRDPFDNAIMTVSKIEKHALMTADRVILGYPKEDLKVIDVAK